MKRGTTLLETLLALALTALVLVALQGVVVRARTIRASSSASADRVAAARTVLLQLGGELEAAAADVAVRAPDVARVPWSALRLVTVARDAAPADVPASDRRLVAWTVEPERTAGAADSGVLVRRESLRPDPPGVEPTGTPLLHGVRRFAVRCFDGTTWTPVWAPGPLPAAVEVVLGVDDGAGGTDEVATTIRLPVGAG